MFVALVGPPASGKDEIARFLCEVQGFRRARISLSSAAREGDVCMPDAGTLLDHVTSHWQTRFVTTDLRDQDEVDAFRKRPFVLVVAVEAPLTVRYRRAIERCVHSPCN